MSTTLIRIPTELHAKLKGLAQSRRSTMVDVIHDLVREAEASGELSTDVSTFGIELDVDRDPVRLVLRTDGVPLADLTPEGVTEFADKLELVATRGGSHWVAQEGFQTAISRVGTGIVMERQDPLPDPAAPIARRSLSTAFAKDLAGRLRAAT